MNKKTVVILFGGQSSEHEVSRASASTIIANINHDKYYVIPVGITKEGKWMVYNGLVENIKNGEWEKFGTPAILSPDATHKGLIKIIGNRLKVIPVDVVFPVLHGSFGEDGTVQGLFELAQIPYVGCGVLSSSVSMDKAYTKIIAEKAKIKQAKYLTFTKQESKKMKGIITKIEKKLGYPCFIKPANAGSSVGISKAGNADEVAQGFELAFKYDKKIIVESMVVGREVECAVIGNENAKASSVGEVLTAGEFYDYDSKYNDANSKTVIPAEISDKKQEEIKSMAIKAFEAVNGSGLARVDFFIEEGTEHVVFNEINTLPGFTSISMYPKLWEDAGMPINELIDELINLALNKN